MNFWTLIQKNICNISVLIFITSYIFGDGGGFFKDPGLVHVKGKIEPTWILHNAKYLVIIFVCLVLLKQYLPKFLAGFYKQKKCQENQAQLQNRVWFVLTKFLPIIWPRKQIELQLCFAACLVLLVAGRILNLFVPWFNKSVVDSLSDFTQPFRWDLILLSATLGFSNRLSELAHSYFWSHLEHHNTQTIQCLFFQHVHALPHRWHQRHKTGDVFSIAEDGTEGLNKILEHVLLSIIPAIADIFICIAYLSTIFSGWVGAIVIAQVLLYLSATIALMEWKKVRHRPMNAAYVAKHRFSLDSLLNFETVKYFCNERYECEEMRKRIVEFQAHEFKVEAAGKVMDLVQLGIITGGLLVTSLITGWQVYDGMCTVGDYFLFFSHFAQLHGLLKYFGNYYRSISISLISMEALMQVLNEKPESDQSLNSQAEVLKPCLQTPYQFQGHVEFRNISFGYDAGKPILKNVSFSLLAGHSLALVGPSGEGKSTILKLMYRFFEPWSGSILLDGQDIRSFPLKTLRSLMGIVPQDTILFNDTLRKNILYGDVKASQEQVVAAAKYAFIHEKCSSFPGKYETQVGERGFCLSGGERLRITIARMFLKNSLIYCLDEPTASLDSATEQVIMVHLHELCKDKTSIMITHRLATAMRSDVILVIDNGEIVETGNHLDLMAQNGRYAQMWKEQQGSYESRWISNLSFD